MSSQAFGVFRATQQIMNLNILDNLNPSDEDVLLWGKDENLCFLDQDEDVVFDYHHIPVLIQLINDNSSPKQGFAFSIVGEMIRNIALECSKRYLIELYELHFSAKSENVLKLLLSQYVERLLLYGKDDISLSFSQAQALARDLLLGVTRFGVFVHTGRENEIYWEFLLQTSVKEYLCVRKNMAVFHYSRNKSWLN